MWSAVPTAPLWIGRAKAPTLRAGGAAKNQSGVEAAAVHSSARTAQARTEIQRQIAATNRRIDKLVHALCGLTDDEIAIAEAAAQRT